VCTYNLFASSSTASVASADPIASQQTLHTIIGLPHLEDDETHDAGPSSRTWPAGKQSDRVTVVESTANSDSASDRDTTAVSFVI